MDRLFTSMTNMARPAILGLGILLWIGVIAAQTGAFSEEQTKQGLALVHEKCGDCHGDDLEGGTESPALKGDAFWSEWDQKTARSLYSRIISTMPPDSPGSLTEKEVIDIVAYIVHSNGMPLGSAPIQNANELNGIKLVRPK
jgi:mono/diheme cytochrome c family protein